MFKYLLIATVILAGSIRRRLHGHHASSRCVYFQYCGEYADALGRWRGKLGGQLGIMTYVPVGKYRVALNAGISTTRGTTFGGGLGW